MGGVDSAGNIKNYSKGYNAFLKLCKTDENWNKLKDIPVPIKYEWIWEHFLTLWRYCQRDFNGNVIMTFRELNDYVQCMKVPLSVEDKKEILKIKQWAVNVISDLEE